MNSGQIIKRTVPVLIIILLIVGAAILGSVLRREKDLPTITDEDGIYLTISDGSRSYNITKKYMYEELKSNVGLKSLLDLIDKHLLESTKKDGVSYLDLVTEEQIDDEIDKAALKKDKEDYTEEELDEAYEEYFNNLFISMGLRTEAEVRDVHRMEIAKKLYATEILKEEIKLADDKAAEDEDADPYFTDTKIDAKYKEQYKTGYWAIIIPFKTEAEAKHALQQVGLKLDEDSKSGKYADLVHIEEDEEGNVVKATNREISEAFIEMYNTFYARYSSTYPNDLLTLKEDVHYRITEEGDLVFNTVIEEDEEMNKLYFKNEEVVLIEKQLENALQGMNYYLKDATKNTWYTAEPRNYDSKLFVYILKIQEVAQPELQEVREKIVEELTEAEVTDLYINKKMALLRESKEIVFFDTALEKSYMTQLESFDIDFKKNKTSDTSLIMKMNDFEVKPDELFKEMDRHYGSSLVASETNYLRFLNSLDLNPIYDYYTPNIKLSERILDKDKWEEIRKSTISEKNIFLSGGYQQFPPTYGWKNFLKDYHGVSDVEELMFSILYRKLRTDYASGLLDIEELTETSEQWLEIVDYMQKMVDDYFMVNGIQVMVSVKDIDGNYVPVEDWSDLQKDYAEELYSDIWEYIENEAGDYDTKLNKLITKFNHAPRFLASLAQDLSVQPELEDNPYVFEEEGSYYIPLSKYKSAGLNLEFLRISTLSNTTDATDTTPEALIDAAKEVFNSLPEGSNEEVRYGYNFGSGVDKYLVSKTGYHVYINTSIVDLAKWNYEDDEDTKFVLPTLLMIQTNQKDNASEVLFDEEGNPTEIKYTAAMKTAITKYFNPIKTEITGSTNVLVKLYQEMLDMSFDFKVNNYSNEDFNSFLGKLIEVYAEDLKYTKAE